MNLKRMWALFVARNYEFIRDRAGFGWNILFPFLIVAGFAVIFSSDSGSDYKVGVFSNLGSKTEMSDMALPEKFKTYRHIRIIPFETKALGLDRLEHHKIDLLVENGGPPFRYWVNPSSPKGYMIEKVIRESVAPDETILPLVIRQEVKGDRIRYIDWLFPGILGMNIMFSALYGVGYVIVRYRRIGVLKRLKATPVTAFEYLSAQLLSRVLIMMASAAVVWYGCTLLFSFKMNGTYGDILIVFLAGTLCLVSLGLVLACRGTNEEFTNGVINFISWPMMFLSEVWFSMEGASEFAKTASKVLPLTHFLSAARKIINDGATLSDVSFEVVLLLGMGAVFLVVGSFLFSWTK